MECFPVVRGKRLPEVYHFGFNGAEFEVFLNPIYWIKFVETSGDGTHYALSQGPTYISPRSEGGTFGQHGCATASRTLDGYVCIKVPAFLENPDDEDQLVSMRELGRTLSSILFILQHLLHEADGHNDNAGQGLPQLFVVVTFISHRQEFHSAGLEISLSPLARKYLEEMGDNIPLREAMQSMEEHYLKSSRLKTRLFITAMDVHLREYGVLHLHTVGNCACLGTIPRDFGNEGYCLSSHNVDTVYQQFNLLVGIASVWQMVRDGLRGKM